LAQRASDALASASASEARWAKGAPKGLVDGVPTTIKDIVWIEHRIIRYGSSVTEAVPAIADAPAVARLRAAGCVIIGLTTGRGREGFLIEKRGFWWSGLHPRTGRYVVEIDGKRIRTNNIRKV